MSDILIIGSFNKPKNGSYGGVYYACNTLVQELEKIGYSVIKLDITLKDINETGIVKRLPNLLLRNIKICYSIIINKKVNNVLIFVSAGNSYFDKLPFVSISRLLKKRVYLFPRSGFILQDYPKMKYKTVINTVLKNSDYIICQSLFWKSFFQSCKVPEEKLEVIENWVTEETIRKSKLLNYNCYLPDEAIKIVYVGRIEEAKGIKDLIGCAVIFKEKDIKFQMSIYGDGSFKSQLLSDIKNYKLEKFISYKGWLDSGILQKEINQYHLALFTSRFEGFPNAFLDLIFSKIPIIIADIDSVKSVSQNLCSFYTPGDDDELAKEIINCMANYSVTKAKAEKLYESKLVTNNVSNSIQQLTKILN